MAFPQGINFRATAGYVTDGTGEDPELPVGGNSTYPRTTAQGNSVGWETDAGNQIQERNRNASNDRRLAGFNGLNSGTSVLDYRIDLSATGNWNIKVACGEANYSRSVDLEVLDDSSSLGVLVSGSTGAANSFKDATNSTYTQANWPGSNTAVTKTFTTTIARFRYGTASTNTVYAAHLYVEAASASAAGPLIAGKLVGGGILMKGRLVG